MAAIVAVVINTKISLKLGERLQQLGPLLTRAVTVRRSINREWLKLHYATILAQRRRMETLKLKICHCLNYESHIYLGMLRKMNANSVKRMRKRKTNRMLDVS